MIAESRGVGMWRVPRKAQFLLGSALPGTPVQAPSPHRSRPLWVLSSRLPLAPLAAASTLALENQGAKAILGCVPPFGWNHEG